MEHRKKGRKLKRTASHRKALLANLAISLIKHKRIKTTLAKAKELRTYIEPFITKAKKVFLLKGKSPETGVHNRRIIFKNLQDREAVVELFEKIGEMVKDRQGGYTRILKAGFRQGDSAPAAIIEFVDFNITKTKEHKHDEKDAKKIKSANEEKPEGVKSEDETEDKREKKEKSSKKTAEARSSKPKREKSDIKKDEKRKVTKNKSESTDKKNIKSKSGKRGK